MTRQLRFEFLGWGKRHRHLLNHHRPLRLEPLEDRRILAVFSVSNLDDSGTGSLRDAIEQANATVGADTIGFSAALSGQTITLAGTELSITEALTIDATGHAANITIDANQASRVMTIDDPNTELEAFDVTLAGLVLTGGRTIGDNVDPEVDPEADIDTTYSGGAIRSLTRGKLTLDRSTVSGNSTTGAFARGGGIRAFGAVTLTQSTVSGNSTVGVGAYGGGMAVVYGNVTLTQSTVSGNHTEGDEAWGGGISADSVTLAKSTVSGNFTRGVTSFGGGIAAYYGVTLTESTVSGNHTEGDEAWGGGIYALGLTLNEGVTLTRSTVSGNHTEGDVSPGGGIVAYYGVTLNESTVSGNHTEGVASIGGGILALDKVTLIQSTITGNRADDSGAAGGGIYQLDFDSNYPLSITGSILSGNTAGAGPDLVPDPDSTLSVDFSVIGTSITPTSGNNNVSTDDPQLGPLADHGGLTQTHALLAGSPALDAGDPGIAFDPDDFDQRGPGFVRVADAGVGGLRIDIGAYESQDVTMAFPDGDYNQDGIADAADFTVWRDTLGSTTDLRANGDDTGASQGVIDQADYLFWKANFGNTTVPSQIAVAAESALDAATSAAPSADAAMASAYPAGDYNHDGITDAVDYVIWRQTLGSTTDLRANGDDTGASQGIIDQADFVFWKANFGSTIVPLPSKGAGGSSFVSTPDDVVAPAPSTDAAFALRVAETRHVATAFRAMRSAVAEVSLDDTEELRLVDRIVSDDGLDTITRLPETPRRQQENARPMDATLDRPLVIAFAEWP